ncbi:TPA: hypothetical protein KBN24_004554 [Escherichia coli]|nr:hypothetical protein [Escherichia coli]
MKYIAVLLAILSAGSAWGGELVNYVPTSLTIYGSYSVGLKPIVQHTQPWDNPSGPVTLTMVVNDKPTAKTPLRIDSVRNVYEGFENGVFTISGTNGPKLWINDNFTMTASYTPGYSHFAEIPYIHDDLTNLYLPPNGSSEQQKMHVYCDLPQNIKGTSGSVEVKLGASILLIPAGTIDIRVQRSIVGTCTWQLRAIYSLSLTLEKTVMSIVDKVGSTTIHNNKLHVAGNGGAVLITIDNPAQEDINTSFSNTQPDVLTTTTKPSVDGTTVPFYVAVKNTRAGSRTYNVNFTAAYI